MFHILAAVHLLTGIGCIAYDPNDVELVVGGFLFLVLSVVYVNEGRSERREKRMKA